MDRRTFIGAAASALAPAASAAPQDVVPPWGAAAGPWSASASAAILTEERRFRNGDATLAGTLYLPHAARPVAAVVALHDASTPLRGAPLYAHLRTMLPPLGVAVFLFDRRGSGQSGGDLQKSDFTVLADDGIAAVKMLAADRRIDPKRIGVWGLSQGGWLSVLAAARDPQIAFAVSISAPVVTPDVQMMFSSINNLRVNGYGEADIGEMTALRQAFDDYMRGAGPKAEAERRLAAARSKPWFKYLYMPTAVPDRATSRWRREIEDDPLQNLLKVRQPTLLVFGADDPVVPVATSVEKIRTLQPERRNLQVRVIAGADHEMQTTVTAKDLLDPNKLGVGRPDADEYFGLLASWLTRIGAATRP